MKRRTFVVAAVSAIVTPYSSAQNVGGKRNTMDELLQRLDALLKQKRPDYYSQLNPPATPEAIRKLEAVLPRALPVDFKKLYLWKNGQNDNNLDSMIDNRMFVRIEDITNSKVEFDSMIGLDFEDKKYWRRGWVPFLHNGGGSYLCVDLLAEDGGTPGQLIAFWKADKDRPIEHKSIEDWTRNLVRLLETNTLKIS